MTILIERLKQLRDQRGVTQGQVAEACGISPISLARYETGTRKPTTDILSRLAAYYGVSVDYILGRDPVTTAPPTREPQPAQDAPYEIRILHRGNSTMTQEQLDRREALMRLLWDMDDDGLDTAERLINIVNGKKD